MNVSTKDPPSWISRSLFFQPAAQAFGYVWIRCWPKASFTKLLTQHHSLQLSHSSANRAVLPPEQLHMRVLLSTIMCCPDWCCMCRERWSAPSGSGLYFVGQYNISQIFWFRVQSFSSQHTTTTWCLTSEFPVHRVDSAESRTAPSVQHPAACSHSGPVLSGGTGWTSEPSP